ncbi:hypothetical protein L7F22_010183 [Adiantum nelumboides]|nr:hypothetical protein [Adiantum nelumboides]
MNEFLACVRRGRTIDTYYEDLIKLSRHAPLITKEQKLSRFILGLEGKLADEVEALRPTSLADALIQAKPKFSSFLKSNNQQGEQKREHPYHFESSHRPHKFQNMARPMNRSKVQPVRVNALPITQGGSPIQCFECGQERHKRMHCPQMRQNRGFQYQNRGPQRHNLVTSNQNRNQRISNAAHQNPNKILVKTVANYLTITDEVTDQAHVYAALDPSGRNRQYSILEAQGDYQGKSLTFMIDSGSSHSFISPSTVKHLHLEPRSTGKKLQVSLASGSIVSCEEQIVELLFQLEGHSTSQSLRVLKMEKFQGILGMDWLSKNKADIHCSQGTVSFYSLNKEQVYIHGRRGNAPLRVVKAKQLIKGLRKGLSLYVLKLNKPEKESKEKETEDKEPEWLSEFLDVFLEELTDLPPTRGLVHDITLVPGAQPIAKSPYKMSLFEALELKNQLTQHFQFLRTYIFFGKSIYDSFHLPTLQESFANLPLFLPGSQEEYFALPPSPESQDILANPPFPDHQKLFAHLFLLNVQECFASSLFLPGLQDSFTSPSLPKYQGLPAILFPVHQVVLCCILEIQDFLDISLNCLC